MSDGGTDCRAPGERPKPGQGQINGLDVRDMTDRQLVRHLHKPWGAPMMDLLRAEAKYRGLV